MFDGFLNGSVLIGVTLQYCGELNSFFGIRPFGILLIRECLCQRELPGHDIIFNRIRLFNFMVFRNVKEDTLFIQMISLRCFLLFDFICAVRHEVLCCFIVSFPVCSELQHHLIRGIFLSVYDHTVIIPVKDLKGSGQIGITLRPVSCFNISFGETEASEDRLFTLCVFLSGSDRSVVSVLFHFKDCLLSIFGNCLSVCVIDIGTLQGISLRCFCFLQFIRTEREDDIAVHRIQTVTAGVICLIRKSDPVCTVFL